MHCLFCDQIVDFCGRRSDRHAFLIDAEIVDHFENRLVSSFP
jgi:hypothetical protein